MFLLPLIRWIAAILPQHGFWRDRRAVTSIEYVIIAIIIAVAILGGLSRIGGYLTIDFNNVSSEL
jgi:pilus assembly protein Flp/PilA